MTYSPMTSSNWPLSRKLKPSLYILLAVVEAIFQMLNPMALAICSSDLGRDLSCQRLLIRTCYLKIIQAYRTIPFMRNIDYSTQHPLLPQTIIGATMTITRETWLPGLLAD